MASKLTVFAALFVCFLVLTEASFRVPTTVVDEEENPQQRRQCQQQIQMPRIHSCHLYILGQQRDVGSRWDDELEMNPQIRGQGSIQQCCEQMRNIDNECRCEALQEVARAVQRDQQQEQGGRYSGSSRGGQQQRIQQQVRRIPQMCRIQVPRQCQQQGY